MAQTLEISVLNILESPEVARVQFRLLGVDVSSGGYLEIAGKIREGHITVPDEIDAELVKEGAGAAYSGHFNKFRFGSRQFGHREWNSYVVHEATHALVDMRKIAISKIDDEVVAHTAQMVYLQRAGFGFRSHGITNKTWFPARDVADSIVRTGIPDETLVNKLREAVKADPFYHDFIGKIAFVDG